ncbi:hypothetical protein [Neptuniibacter sp. QD37_11]|uniref:hypothetical protein n=1 Tax=Neptuniibacter sp. QD37_11 TaxID=3398209 RepID=UPI0039F4DA0B
MFKSQKLKDTEAALDFMRRRYLDLRSDWDDLIERINHKGGEDFLLHGLMPDQQEVPFTPEELNKLIQLCHPDKHDGKQSAVEMTQKLLSLRS